MAGMGQPFNLSGRNSGLRQTPSQTGKRQGLFGEEEGSDSSIHFSIPTSFGAQKEIMTSPSPSQLSSFPSNMFAQPGSITIQQRGMPAAPFQRNVTPTSMQTSMAPSFPIGLQQAQGQQPGQPPLPPGQPSQGPVSPNRNLFNLGPSQRSLLGGSGVSQGSIGSQIKRSNPMSSGIISPNRIMPNAFSSLQQQLSNQRSAIITSSTSSTLTSMSGYGRASNFTLPLGTDTAQASIDLSEFPSLGNRSSSSNPLPSAPRSYVGMVSKPVQDSAPEFQIQQEDFPALPGAQNPPSAAAVEAARKSLLTSSSIGGSSTYDQALKDSGKFIGDGKNGQQKRGIQTLPDGTVTNIPSGMVTDQFGMVGLLTFIRAAETDPNLVALAPGIDLTTLGLNLNSPENLYSTFQSPWADAPCRPQDIDFHVPSEYLTNIFIREKLAPIKLNRYQEDLLFFLFYMNGGDVLQLAAAAELYSRDWRYHKEERVWITRAPSIEPLMKTSTYERGTYYFFDVQNWRKVAKEFHLEYDKLEERPHLPTNLQSSTPQPPTPGVLAH